MNITKLTYSEKLLDPRWQRLRLEILQRDDFMCQLCSDTESTLHVHHKKYLFGKDPWEYEQDNFITYCEACHKIIEENKETKDFVFISARKIPSPQEWINGIVLTCSYTDKLLICLYKYDTISKELVYVTCFGAEALKVINEQYERDIQKIQKS